jgi:protein-S-isoprenylcysteine O-methyltransferase Ste14
LAGLAAGLALDGRLTELRFNSMPFVALGMTCAAVGLLLVLSALGLFHRKGTKPEPWKPSSSLVTSGVYRFTRNPMYLGMLLLYAGIALIWAGPWSATLFPLIFLILNFYVVAREEAYLTRRFGEAYGSYQMQVRRWL